MAHTYIQTARGTGRTTSLLDSLRDGDRVCCVDAREARRLTELAHERGLKVEFLALPVSTPDRLFQRGTSEGRTIFDHSWVEQYFLAAIEQAQRDIDHLQRQTSGYGEAHLETKRQAKEFKR
jgi:hypothetical protein